VEAHLQTLLAAQVELLGPGFTLIRREYPTPVGPVDLLCRDAPGAVAAVQITRPGDIEGRSEMPTHAPVRHVAVEIKRKASIDAVEQLSRYLEYLNRDRLLAPVGGVLAAQSITPQAQTLAGDRGIRCLILDYEQMRGIDLAGTLF
jgi:endonuclease